MSTKINWHPVKSSQLKRIAYDTEAKEAIVQFHNGGLYAYKQVPAETFELLKAAESPGKFLGSEIKGKFQFRKITDAAEIMDLTTEEKPHINAASESI